MGLRSHTDSAKFGEVRVLGELEFGGEAAVEMEEDFSLLQQRRTDGRTDGDSDTDPIDT